MQEFSIIDLTPDNIPEYGVCRYKDPKNKGYADKAEWFNKYYGKGLRIKCLLFPKDGVQGMIEYIPGELCWRPVNASGYMFIHCLFAGFKSAYKNKGYASMLIDACLNDAREADKAGVAVVTRKGSFMADKDIFIKKGFVKISSAPPDFELLALKFNKNAPSPEFRNSINENPSRYGQGLVIIRSAQCPYTRNNVDEIIETAKNRFGISAEIVENFSPAEARENPCAFGSFCMIYNNKIISHHPISNTRFVNIMNSALSPKGKKAKL